MFEVSIRGVAQELEQVVVKTVGVGSVDDHVGNGQDFEEQTCSLTLIDTWLEKKSVINLKF